MVRFNILAEVLFTARDDPAPARCLQGELHAGDKLGIGHHSDVPVVVHVVQVNLGCAACHQPRFRVEGREFELVIVIATLRGILNIEAGQRAFFDDRCDNNKVH